MDEERFISARENPRFLGGFGNGNNGGNKAMAGEVSKAVPSILDRFRALMREREEEIMLLGGDEIPLPRSEEIVRIYELVLGELTFNSKPIITDLTIIAGEQREHGEGIADAICTRILEVPVEQKLPSFYLLDSIVKNIGREYVRYFSSRLPEVFCEAYKQVHPNLHPAMRHLFGTWLTVFPPSVLRMIEAQLQFSPSANHQSSALKASESPRPTHGIHVNPKYLEARRQFGHSTADGNNQHMRGTSSTLKIYGQTPASGYDEYDSDNAEFLSSEVGGQRLSSTGYAGHTSFTLGAEKLLPSPAVRHGKSSSPFRIEHGRSLSPPVDEFVVGNSPRRVVERPASSHFGFGYGPGRMTGREELSDRQRSPWSDGSHRRSETSAAYGNGLELRRPRALIDAYGNDQRRETQNYNPLKVDINGIDNKVGAKTWQNTEEKEFDWEDMSPTLVDRSLSKNPLSSSIPPLESFRTRPGYAKHDPAPLDSDFRRSNRSIQAQISAVNDSSIILEDAVPSVSSVRGSSSKITGLHDEPSQFLGARSRQEAFPHSIAQSSRHPLSSEGGGTTFQMLPSSSGNQKSLIDSFPDADAQLRGSSAIASRMRAESIASWKSESLATAVPPSTGAWPVNIQKTHPFSVLPPLPQQKKIKSQFDPMNAGNTVMNQGLNKSFLPEHQFNSIENKALSSIKSPSFPNHLALPVPLNPQNRERVTPTQPQLLPQEVRRNLVPPPAIPAVVSMPSLIPPLAHGYIREGHNAATSNVMSNPIPGVHPSMPFLNTPSSSMHLHGAGFPPLPTGPRPDSSQMIPISHNPGPIVPNPRGGVALSGLISSLVAQGLISLTNQSPVQESVGLEFNPDVLKVRHESAITALYADLPRQCTTCGLRFKCQEEHSSHMDWHVTKNRISKTRKQKPSRKWFVSVNMWLSGAEALGTEAVPGFLTGESDVEKDDDEEFAVPADEDQNVCALCGEPFDDFYSDETEEWMYRGAVYMNAPSGSAAGLDRSQLGPIVHAKCRSESSMVSPEDFGQDEGGYTEEGSQRKRLRT
ncbi:Polyadenylation and cleavage factor like [Actinidia chinensis var. chinensis]|uniref:Polyadenylation and cleavage factor like n=1 Tax=Actinidia chinensis var. chinensis TaxID=1590841 RepID=A0A2R6QLS4_ACTCC|nr:Polyadenylation and cleavage factor like [Actinidia chinensis var. chinensis]